MNVSPSSSFPLKLVTVKPTLAASKKINAGLQGLATDTGLGNRVSTGLPTIVSSLISASYYIGFLLGSVLTLTTPPIALTDGLAWLGRPLRRLRVPTDELALMVTIALRFIPTLLVEMDTIMRAQRARGADFRSGGLVARARALVPVLVPLFVLSFRRADDLALAMEARCYRPGVVRTRLHPLRAGWRDAVLLVATAGVIVLALLV